MGDSTELDALDWNFDRVPDSELVACCYWEFARESAFIRDVKRRCIDSKWCHMANREAWAFVGADIERIQSIGYPAEVFLRGFFFDEAEDRKPRHPEAPPITGSFPRPWQTVAEAERKDRAPIRSDRKAIPLVPFRRGHAFFAEDIAPWYKSRRAGAKPGEEIPPSLFLASSEVGVFEINWGTFANDELAAGFRKWAKANRPQQFPNPSGQGHKPGDWRANLTRLAVMRLPARFTAMDLVDPAGTASRPSGKRSSFPGASGAT